MVLNRMRRLSSRNLKVPSTVLEEDSTEGNTGNLPESKLSSLRTERAPDAPSQKPLLPPSPSASASGSGAEVPIGDEGTAMPLRSETVMSDPGNQQDNVNFVDDHEMSDRTLSAPHSLTHANASD